VLGKKRGGVTKLVALKIVNLKKEDWGSRNLFTNSEESI
jgi:hypothetical protein